MEKPIFSELSKQTTAALVGIAILSGLVGGAVTSRLSAKITGAQTSNSIVEQHSYVEESESIDAINKVVPATLSIVATKDLPIFRQNSVDPFFNDPFFREFGFGFPQMQPRQQQPESGETRREQVSGGTGFVVSEDGFGLTNKHVVADTSADYTAISKDGKEYDVEVIGRDTVNDLAVIQLHEKTKDDTDRKTGEKKNFGPKPSKLPTVTLGDSSKLQVGQKVLAIGNARGEYQNSVTSGIVSALEREIQATTQNGGGSETLSGLIQTDAAINFGNSGGPLINLAGQVIGVNTAIDASATGVGFAIPVNQIKPVLDSVKKNGRIVRPVLGVTHVILSKEQAAELKLEGLEYGALVTGDRSKKEFGVLPGSPAEKAGLKIDDVILEVDGEKITTQNTLQSMVQKHLPGDTLKLKVWRAGGTFEVSVKLDERKE